jgi:hypothetical protein
MNIIIFYHILQLLCYYIFRSDYLQHNNPSSCRPPLSSKIFIQLKNHMSNDKRSHRIRYILYSITHAEAFMDFCTYRS